MAGAGERTSIFPGVLLPSRGYMISLDRCLWAAATQVGEESGDRLGARGFKNRHEIVSPGRQMR